GCNSFSEFVDKLKRAGLVEARGHGGHYTIERKGAVGPVVKPEEALPALRELLEIHRIEMEDGAAADDLAHWLQEEFPNFDIKNFGFQGFIEFLTFAQDSYVVRLERKEDGTTVYLGTEFYPPALPPEPEPEPEEEEDGPQPYVEGQPTMMEPN